MKRIYICLLLAGVAVLSASAQNYFERKLPQLGGIGLVNALSTGLAEFDFHRFSEYTLYIAAYDPASIYFEWVEGETYSSLTSEAERQRYYELAHIRAHQNSIWSEFPLQFMDVAYEDMPKEERKNALFFTYCKLRGSYIYNILWASPTGEEPSPVALNPLGGVDVGKETEIRLLMNLLGQEIQMIEQGMMAASLEKMEEVNKEVSDILSNPQLPTQAKVMELYSQNQMEYREQLESFATLNYLSEANESTLLIPTELKSKRLDHAMTNWTLSPIRYEPQASIEQMRLDGVEGYAYIRAFQIGSSMNMVATILIAGTDNDRILYKQMHYIDADKMAYVLRDLGAIFRRRAKKYDTKGAIMYGNIEETQVIDSMPADLDASKVGYLTLTKHQFIFASRVNRIFRKRMEAKYPHTFQSVSSFSELKGCKYRIRLKSYLSSYKTKRNDRVTVVRPNGGIYTRRNATVGDQVIDRDIGMTYIPGYIYILYLEDLETGELYRLQDEPAELKDVIDEFIEAASR